MAWPGFKKRKISGFGSATRFRSPRGIRVENEFGVLDELDRPVLENANARFGTLEVEKNANRASAFFLERPDHCGLPAHLIMRGMAHIINAKEIGAGTK
jgi:hypothetical protein